MGRSDFPFSFFTLLTRATTYFRPLKLAALSQKTGAFSLFLCWNGRSCFSSNFGSLQWNWLDDTSRFYCYFSNIENDELWFGRPVSKINS